MCTLIILNNVIEGYPLVIASNRDERYDRKSKPPEVVEHNGKRFIRPWDDKKDGTWLGISESGWFVGLTNQDDAQHHNDKLSRGKVVVNCLHAGTHNAVARILSNVDPEYYNPFNLVFGRPGSMFLARIMQGKPVEMEEIPEGISVISNDCWGDKYDAKLLRAGALSAVYLSESQTIDNLVDGLHEVLSDHSTVQKDDPFQALCVHALEHHFGTRSTSIIAVSNSSEVEYWYSEGPACCSSAVLTCSLKNNDEKDLAE